MVATPVQCTPGRNRQFRILFFKLTPDRIMKFKGEKLSKGGFTVLVMASILWKERKKLWVLRDKESNAQNAHIYPI